MRTRCQYHCSACNGHFASLSAFDSHRQGSYQEGRYCVEPMDDAEFVCKTEAGSCDHRPGFASGVRIWQMRRDVERAVSRWGVAVSREEEA